VVVSYALKFGVERLGVVVLMVVGGDVAPAVTVAVACEGAFVGVVGAVGVGIGAVAVNEAAIVAVAVV
jgi:hypothetical protein